MAKFCDDAGIIDAHAEIRLQGSETEIEQDGAAVFHPQRAAIAAEFGQHRAPVHRAAIGRQAQRDPLAPAGFGQALGCERSDGFAGRNGNTAPRGHGGYAMCGLRQRYSLVSITRELGDAAERAKAPLRIGIGNLAVQQLERRWRSYERLCSGALVGIDEEFSGIVPGEYRLIPPAQATVRDQKVTPALTM